MTETTIAQGRRLLAAGCPYVNLHIQPANHKIVPDPIPLGRLWDIAHKLGLEHEFPLELTSNELIEAIVTAIEDYYRDDIREKD